MTIDMIVDELRNCEYYAMESTEYPNNKTLVIFKTDTKNIKIIYIYFIFAIIASNSGIDNIITPLSIASLILPVIFVVSFTIK